MTIGGMFESLKRCGYVADRKYETGDISEKTGLQKQPDGSWRVPGQEKDYPEYKGKGQKAVDFLIRQKSGCVNGAMQTVSKIVNKVADLTIGVVTKKI